MSALVGDREPQRGDRLGADEDGSWEGRKRRRKRTRRERGTRGVLPREETKRLLVTTSTWEALHSQSACLSPPFSQGAVAGPAWGLLSSGPWGRL